MHMDKKQYRWAVCTACALLLFCTVGLAQTGFSVYQPYLISVGGLTNTQASAVVLFRNLFGLVGMLAVTPLILRFEVRQVVTGGLLVCSFSFFAYGSAHSFLEYCEAAALAGCALGVGGMIPVSVLISRWFNEHRGLALGICMAATGLSMIVAAPVITLLVCQVSLDFSFFVEGIFVFLVAVVVGIALHICPDNPHEESIGAHHVETAKRYAPCEAPAHLSFFMMLGILILGMAGHNLYSYISVLYQFAGFGNMEISWLLSAFGITLAVGKCVYGQMVDKMGAYWSSWILYILSILGIGVCCLAENGSVEVAVVGVSLMGFGLAVNTVSISVYAADVATEASYPATVTKYQVLSTLGALLFGVAPGAIADMTGDYVSAYVLMLFLTVLGAVILQCAYHTIWERNQKYAVQIVEKRDVVLLGNGSHTVAKHN